MPLQLSYHTTGYIAGALLSTGLVFYLLHLRSKTNQTWYLTLYFFLNMCLSIGFVLRTGIYDPAMAKPSSYVIGLYTAFSNVALLQFIYSFPKRTPGWEPRLAVAIVFLLGCLTYGYYVHSTIDSPVHYNFETQFFEFQNPRSARPMGLLLLTSFLWALVAILRKTIREEKQYRRERARSDGQTTEETLSFSYLRLHSREARALRAFGIAVFLNMLFSATYALYTAGVLSYADFQYILTAAMSIQLVLYAIIYLNNSPQPTSFTVKLVGVAVVTIILVLGLVNRITFRYNEMRYDEKRVAQVNSVRTAVQAGRSPQTEESGAVYVVSWPRDGSPAALLQIHQARFGAISPESFARSVGLEARMRSAASPPTVADLSVDSDRSAAAILQGFRALAPAQPELFFVRYVFPHGRRTYEVGYRYSGYRTSVHRVTAEMSGILLGTTFVLMLAYPFLFHSGLLSPLKRLLSGVTHVNRGDYAVQVPVHVEDEIGFLSRSFNRMVASIRRANEQLREYAESLEEKVRARTSQLQQSLDEVQALKIRQDGDYYLTSLLVDPLSQNHVRSSLTEVQFLTRQRKRFRYGKWGAEIGGDLSTARNIVLRERPYIAFLNSDAMGKSIQGAGGALVIGAVFEAILKRTEFSSALREQFPERWLKNAAMELSNVFSSFQGSMLVSGILGLLDEQGGLLYYVQSEHPDPVLFRNGSARLVRPRFSYPKLGMPFRDVELRVNTLRLRPGDELFFGSDGRDDLELEDGDGELIMQNDDEAFARKVEAARGDLDEILRLLNETGTLIDDISLIRIRYTGPAESRRELGRADLSEVRRIVRLGDGSHAIATLEQLLAARGPERRVLRHMIRACRNLGDTAGCLKYALAYSVLDPSRTDTLITVSECYRELGRLDLAIDFAERVRLRSPKSVRNLRTLVGLYQELGDDERARSLSRELSNLDPTAGFDLVAGT